MACVGNVCGTGGWNGPLPGDPDNNVTLRATPAFGGIDVEWTYPTINPEAVQHTILFRGLSPNFLAAARHAIVSGNFFYDKNSSATPIAYYYWIQLVSVNGTYGDIIGPATATGRPAIAQMIEQLTAQIDAGFLAQSLKGEIDKIELNRLSITQEMLDRDAADDALGVAFNEVQAHSGQTRALLQQEVLARTDANEAFVSTVNTLYAEMGEGLQKAYAAVQSEESARVTALEAVAKSINTVQASLEKSISSVQQTMSSSVSTLSNGLTSVKSLYTVKVQANGLVGGFGIYASDDGVTHEVQAGFDVDTFWIGRTGANKRKPFIIAGSEVFIDEAAINKLTFSKLRDESGSVMVENGKMKAQYLDADNLTVRSAKSANYNPNNAGWFFNPNGQLDINGLAANGAKLKMNEHLIQFIDPNGVLRIRMGSW